MKLFAHYQQAGATIKIPIATPADAEPRNFLPPRDEEEFESNHNHVLDMIDNADMATLYEVLNS